jgi:hypothetical protein
MLAGFALMASGIAVSATGVGAGIGAPAIGLGASLLGGGTAGMAAADMSEKNSREATDQMAKAIAKGLVMKDEEGNVKAVEGSAKELAELGLTTEEVERFGEAVKDGYTELKEYGAQLNALEAQEKAYYQQMANAALGAIDKAQYSSE